MQNQNTMFWFFGGMKTAALGLILFFLLRSLSDIGTDTQVVLSIIFPLFQLITEYIIFSKD